MISAVECKGAHVYVCARKIRATSSMAKIVMKFGGTSVADLERIRNVAGLVKREVDRGHHVAVVVSAMAGETNKLVGWTKELSPLHDAAEYDTVVAAGEQVTSGLLAVALSAIGVPAGSHRSTYSAAILASARLFKVRFNVATTMIPPGFMSRAQESRKSDRLATCSTTSMFSTTSNAAPSSASASAVTTRY